MKTILFSLLLIFSTPLYADWNLIYKNEIIKSEYFLNLNNFKRNKDKVRAWTLENFLEPQKVENLDYLSVKSFVEFNCKESSLRILAYSLYSNNMGKGKAIFSKGSPLKWMKISKNTIFSSYSQIICAESNSE
ncbi:hypothetical protein OAL85_03690 [Methylophilaceae bacterium]|jgi:hypothetical protein|nr:hypothetical protein [Methylophilaceae bacterium]